MSTWKVVLIDYDYASFIPEEEVLAGLGISLTKTQCRTDQEIIAAAKDADAILTQYTPIPRHVIENLDKCQIISLYGIGIDSIDVAAATEKGIIVSNVSDYCIDEVSDHVMAFLLSFSRKTILFNQAVKQGVWDFKVGMPMFRLRGQVLGLVGFGRIPQCVVQKAQAFGLNVIVYKPDFPEKTAQQLNVQLTDLNTLCEQSDFISVHTPLTEATHGLIGPEQFNRMKPEVFIINTARGPVIDERALIRALENKQIAGAGLDVLEVEPISSNHPFLQMDQVILNPHAAWHSVEAEAELKRKVAQNVADVFAGFWPSYLVNEELRERLTLKEKPTVIE